MTGKRTDNDTPAELADYAKRLEDAAKTLRRVSEAMLRKGIHSINILGARGMGKAMRDKIEKYVADAKLKAARRGATID